MRNILLTRQLKSHGIADKKSLSEEETSRLLDVVSKTYDESDLHLGRQESLLEVVNSDYRSAVERLDFMKNNLAFVLAQKTDELIQIQRSVEQQRLAGVAAMAEGIAHEINNPLAIISGYCTALQRQLVSSEPNKDLLESIATRIEKIESAVHRAASVVSGLLQFSELHQGPDQRNLWLGDIVDVSLKMQREKFKEAKVELVATEIPKHAFIKGQAIELSQLVLCLLNNAFDAVSAGQGVRRVEIGFLENQDVIGFRVLDTGPGVPAENEDKILQPFYTTKEVGRGIGLGLSIAFGIATKHGGSIKLNREISSSCFEVTFPRLKA